METLIFLLIVAVVIAVVKYRQYLLKGMCPRTFTTTLSQQQVIDIFDNSVTRLGWKIINDRQPRVAGDHSLMGRGQQIALMFDETGDDELPDQPQDTMDLDATTKGVVGVQRWVSGWFMPKGAHTIRLRLNAFERAVEAADEATKWERHPDALKNPQTVGLSW
ncbi:MAG: hypothetical protein F4Z53_00070 [Acidimicrobiales bacterium]|nr:hypothetical protein [Acidimicrobiales bacterium]MXX41436.1 hypothetical protein [Acidimicrobiales bacterium]MYB81058.1 hypothetical protein [Acidimicrobiales bacterium]MYD34517.1 hypothetical protein [Acidimicrobiales bacterium]MYI09533.1 hypothetical protein [Acidimicrobiales bacterium]